MDATNSTPQTKFQKTKRKRIAIFCIVAFLLLAVALYLCTYYHSVDVEPYLTSSEEVQVSGFDQGIFFDGPGTTKALIFYPGAKVSTEAYAPLMYQLAQKGVDCFLLDMPFHMAFFGINRAEKILENYQYDSWYLGGHSLGGAMAASFAAGHTDELDGLLLLASYTTKDLSQSDLLVVTIYGSEDGVLNRKSLEKGRALLPANSIEKCLEGGNHGQFGSYGDQKGDGKASISREEQIEETIEIFLDKIQS